MNNKPVAVVDHRQQNGVTWLKIKKGQSVMPDHNTLLYTHPAKTLTNEKILQANLEFGKENGEDYSMLTIEDIEPLIGLVKFILRKAQE